MKQIIKYIFISLGSVVLLLILMGVLFLNLSPQFGGKASEKEISYFNTLEYFNEGAFINLIPTSMDMGFSKILEVMGDFMEGTPNGRPSSELPQQKISPTQLEQDTSQIFWFGHSAFLLQLDGKIILFDPMFGDVPAPHPMMGTKRFSHQLPLEIEEIPSIDFLFISHDHYDHLDYESILQLKEKTKYFLVPLGVGAHFRKWGIAEDKIIEMGWWDEQTIEGFTIAFTPSRHFSGRGLTRNSTLWGSWVLAGQTQNIYFSGDGGYGPHFKEIGEKYGPFDLALMECGQYHENWAQIHMMPEETALAGVDVQAKLMMPIHWGAFELALHTWNDPIIRVSKKAHELNLPIIAPQIGERILLPATDYKNTPWWKI